MKFTSSNYYIYNQNILDDLLGIEAKQKNNDLHIIDL